MFLPPIPKMTGLERKMNDLGISIVSMDIPILGNPQLELCFCFGHAGSCDSSVSPLKVRFAKRLTSSKPMSPCTLVYPRFPRSSPGPRGSFGWYEVIDELLSAQQWQTEGKKYYVPLRIGNIGNWLSVKLFIGWQIHVNIPYSLGKSI